MPARRRPVQPDVIRPLECAPGNRQALAPAPRVDSRPKRRASTKPPLILAVHDGRDREAAAGRSKALTRASGPRRRPTTEATNETPDLPLPTRARRTRA